MKRVVLRHALSARPVAEDFETVEASIPDCPSDGVLAQVIHLSLDPYVGSRLRGRHMGEPPPRPGLDPIPGAAVARVVESRAAGLSVGDWIHTMEAGWQEFVALDASDARRIDISLAPPAAHVAMLGMPGLTAWAGITRLARIRPGDTVLVDAAAGAVGGMAGQIARLAGAGRVVGIAGGPEKCALAREVHGFDACVDYRAEGWEDLLAQTLRTGLDVHFENVSVALANRALGLMRPYGRLVLCGLADQYHADTPAPGLAAGLIVGKRAQVHGLVVYDFYDRWADFLDEVGPAVGAGAIRLAEDRAVGLDAAPGLFQRLMEGRNIGKTVVSVAPDLTAV